MPTSTNGHTLFMPQEAINESAQIANKIINDQSSGLGIRPDEAQRLAECFLTFVQWRASEGFDPYWHEALARSEGTESIQRGLMNEFAACAPGSRIAGQPIV